MIPISAALSQTPDYAARSRTQGASASHGVTVYAPAFAGAGDRDTWVWTTCPRLLLDSAAAGLELRPL